MTQSELNEKQLAELGEMLELAKVTEQKAKELCEMGEAFAQKYEKRLREFKEASMK
ncbi:hypothetical protein ACE1CI_31100 [Aerosakkonemataceae cyanobacterium BLCC-F50]|uniref:Uncharacterized protein n=1 Tax=Floridaenema flaviceps BLCC-F50 TaxID=3153642 RepID=A0ABV4Y066_9CYAN